MWLVIPRTTYYNRTEAIDYIDHYYMGGRMENWSLSSKDFKRTAGERIGWESEAEQLNTEQPRGTKTNQILDSLNHNMPMPLVGPMLNELKNVQDTSKI